jgi:hypothetical protein
MVAVINPSTEKTLAKYKAGASGLKTSTVPKGVFGGEFGAPLP